MTSCAILQPSYLPWRGVFGQIATVDLFVHYDDVQLDKRGWRHRNVVKGPEGPFWITIPLSLPGGSHGTLIRDALIAPDHTAFWQQKHWNAIANTYSRANHFEWVTSWLNPFYLQPVERLVDITVPLLETIASKCGIPQPKFLRSSDLKVSGERSERLLTICKELGADTYVSGPAAESYLDVKLFRREGVSVNFVSYDFEPYRPLFGDYDPHVSIVDYLAMRGPVELDASFQSGVQLRGPSATEA